MGLKPGFKRTRGNLRIDLEQAENSETESEATQCPRALIHSLPRSMCEGMGEVNGILRISLSLRVAERWRFILPFNLLSPFILLPCANHNSSHPHACFYLPAFCFFA